MKRTEKRVFAPYSSIDKCISIAFAPTAAEELHAEQTVFYVSDADLFAGISPKAEVHVDQELIKKTLSIGLNNVSLAIVFRNQESKDYRLLATYELDKIPKKKSISISDHYGGPIKAFSELSISFVVFLRTEIARSPNSPYRQGAIIAQREVKICRDVSALKFPIVAKNPTEFASEGLPKNTVWFVKMLSKDVDAPTDSVVEVWINSESRPKLDALMGLNRAGHVLAVEFVAEILAVISKKVFLEAKNAAENDTSLQKSLEKQFGQVFGLSFDDLREVANSEDSEQRFRAYAHAISGLDKSIATYG